MIHHDQLFDVTFCVSTNSLTSITYTIINWQFQYGYLKKMQNHSSEQHVPICDERKESPFIITSASSNCTWNKTRILVAHFAGSQCQGTEILLIIARFGGVHFPPAATPSCFDPFRGRELTNSRNCCWKLTVNAATK